jgi:hypothetical protein
VIEGGDHPKKFTKRYAKALRLDGEKKVPR